MTVSGIGTRGENAPRADRSASGSAIALCERGMAAAAAAAAAAAGAAVEERPRAAGGAAGGCGAPESAAAAAAAAQLGPPVSLGVSGGEPPWAARRARPGIPFAKSASHAHERPRRLPPRRARRRRRRHGAASAGIEWFDWRPRLAGDRRRHRSRRARRRRRRRRARGRRHAAARATPSAGDGEVERHAAAGAAPTAARDLGAAAESLANRPGCRPVSFASASNVLCCCFALSCSIPAAMSLDMPAMSLSIARCHMRRT